MNSARENTVSLEDFLEVQLTRPKRVREKVEQTQELVDLPKRLGSFLEDTGFISGINFRDTWFDEYHSGTKEILIGKHDMPEENYPKYIFTLGETAPLYGEETKQYTFLHEVNHAYQNYLQHKESPENPSQWFSKVIQGRIDSHYARLFEYIRTNIRNLPNWDTHGLSTFGNEAAYRTEVPDINSRKATRTMEDANELVNMYIWDPVYLHTFLEYISGGTTYSDESIYRDGFVKLPNSEIAQGILHLVQNYVKEMMETISAHEANKNKATNAKNRIHQTAISILQKLSGS